MFLPFYDLFNIVPEDPPANIRVVGNDPSSVAVSWIPPSVPNGIIMSYDLYINYNDVSPLSAIQSGALNTNYIITGLRPYQLVSVMISASTVAGEGPRSEMYSGRAREQGKRSLPDD